MFTPLILSIEPTNPTQEMRVCRTLPSPTVARPLRRTGVRTCHGQSSPTVARPSTATELLRSHPAAGDSGRRKSSTSSVMSWYFVTAAKLPQSPGDSGRRQSSHPDDQTFKPTLVHSEVGMIETCEPTFDINSRSLLSSCRSNQPTQLRKMRVRLTLPLPTVTKHEYSSHQQKDRKRERIVITKHVVHTIPLVGGSPIPYIHPGAQQRGQRRRVQPDDQ